MEHHFRCSQAAQSYFSHSFFLCPFIAKRVYLSFGVKAEPSNLIGQSGRRNIDALEK